MQKKQLTEQKNEKEWKEWCKEKGPRMRDKFALIVFVYAAFVTYLLCTKTPQVEESNGAPEVIKSSSKEDYGRDLGPQTREIGENNEASMAVKANFVEHDGNNYDRPKTHKESKFEERLDSFSKGTSRSIKILENIDLTPLGDLASINPRPSCFVANVNRTKSDIQFWDEEPSLPIVNLGMPKSGTTTLNGAMKCLGIRSNHHMCDNKLECGPCMQKAVENGLPPLSHCGKGAKAFTQLNYNHPANCVYPEITMLDEIHREAPNATYVLIFRPIDDWIRSLRAWDKLDERIASCELPMKPSGVGLTDEELREFVCRHVMYIREFVGQHPSHRLIEMELYEDNSELLFEIFPSRLKRRARNARLGAQVNFRSRSCWRAKNVNKSVRSAQKNSDGENVVPNRPRDS